MTSAIENVMATQWEQAATEQESPHPQPAVCHEEIYQGYKTLVKNVADNLQKEDVDSIKYTEDMPNGSNALDVLSELEKRGRFSCYNIERLEDMLRGINRCDIITRFVEEYKQHYGSPTVQGRGKSPSALRIRRVSSAPPHSSPRLHQKRRSLQSGNTTNPTTSHPVTEFHSLREEDEGHSSQGLVSLPATFSGRSVFVVPGMKGWSHVFASSTDSQGASQEAPDTELLVAHNTRQGSTMVGGALPPRHSTPLSSQLQLSQTRLPEVIPPRPHSPHQSGNVSADESYPCSFLEYTTSGLSSLHHTGASSGQPHYQMDTTGLQHHARSRTAQLEPLELSNALQRRLSSQLEPHTHSSQPTLNDASTQPSYHCPTTSQPTVYRTYTPPQPLASRSVGKQVALDLAAASSDTQLSPSRISGTPRTNNHQVPAQAANGVATQSQSIAIPSSSMSSHNSQPGKQSQGIPHRQKPKSGFNCVSESWIINRKELCTNITGHNKGSYTRMKTRMSLELGSKHSPQLGLKIFPYGEDSDCGEYATLEADIYVPSKCKEWIVYNCKVRLQVSVTDGKSAEILSDASAECELRKQSFRIHQFLSHQSIIRSKSITLTVHATAELEYIPEDTSNSLITRAVECPELELDEEYVEILSITDCNQT